MSDTVGMALLERELPLASLADCAGQARRGEGRLVLVAGEAGVGKSALLDQVLTLVCAGHTNAEIAAKLFITAKTVEHHVSAVLEKLGAPTRQAAASQAARLGLAGAAGK
jgi:DNA-binding CsgD family transcriptional regulator